ncbi:lysophospholipid acyltransferase 5-like [Apostichopus japonicus]|uniref:lysophospholipid acyltransferase 5-like n=1 Tax=Stichopus japonicus TaxID=307972 RepID=UPI003AB18568
MEALRGAVNDIADVIGVPAAGVFFLFTLLLSIPLCYVLKDLLDGRPAFQKHLCFTLIGLGLSYLNYGIDCGHYIISLLVNFALLRLVGGTQLSVALSFLFNMGYLLAAYYCVSTDGYDIIWTTPHCIITLRMMGIAFDLFDGQTPKEKLSKDQQATCISKAPSLLELFSATFFLGGHFAGPQFSFKMYLDFIHEQGVYKAIRGKDCPDRLTPTLKAAISGIVIVLFFAACNPFLNPDIIASSEFEHLPILEKVAKLSIFGVLFYFKYIGFWLITESICMAAGLGYNGTDENGGHKWDALVGVHVYDLLTTYKYRVIIRSFNLTTNLWTARYIYKRCRFLGNRFLSQGISLFFLAVWHGFYPGYFFCFMLEMIYVIAEDQVINLCDKVPVLKALTSSPAAQVPLYIFLKAFNMFFWCYAILSFNYLRVSKVHYVWSQYYYVGHVVYGTWFLVYFTLIVPRLKKMAKTEEKDKLKKSD